MAFTAGVHGAGFACAVAPAGEIISYANYDIGLAGLLAESVSGRPFHEVVSREILQPLGMGRSSFGWSRPCSTGSRRDTSSPRVRSD